MSRILFVEDNIPLRTATRMWLTTCGHNVTAVGTGAEAMSQVQTGTFDLILCDIGLPDINGTELIRRIRIHTDTPAVSYSAFDDLSHLYPDIDTLFVAHIPKNADPEQLQSTLDRVLAA